MKRIVTAAALFCAIIHSASPARAQTEWPGRFYVEARGGVSAAADVYLTDIEQAGQPLSTRPPLNGGPNEIGVGWLDYKVGWMAAAAGGYQINDYFRAELEVSYRSSQIKELDLRNLASSLGREGPAGSVPASGGASLIAGLVNGYFDIRQSPDQRIVPFLLAGVGAGYLDYGLVSPALGYFETKQAVFAWNAGFGVLGSVTRHVGVTVAYHYTGTPEVDVPSLIPGVPALKIPYGAHEAYVGLRYTF